MLKKGKDKRTPQVEIVLMESLASDDYLLRSTGKELGFDFV